MYNEQEIPFNVKIRPKKKKKVERSFRGNKKNQNHDNNKYDFRCRASLAVTGISPPRQTPRQHPDNLIICMTLAMRPRWGLGGEGGRGGSRSCNHHQQTRRLPATGRNPTPALWRYEPRSGGRRPRAPLCWGAAGRCGPRGWARCGEAFCFCVRSYSSPRGSGAAGHCGAR